LACEKFVSVHMFVNVNAIPMSVAEARRETDSFKYATFKSRRCTSPVTFSIRVVVFTFKILKVLTSLAMAASLPNTVEFVSAVSLDAPIVMFTLSFLSASVVAIKAKLDVVAFAEFAIYPSTAASFPKMVVFFATVSFDAPMSDVKLDAVALTAPVMALETFDSSLFRVEFTSLTIFIAEPFTSFTMNASFPNRVEVFTAVSFEAPIVEFREAKLVVVALAEDLMVLNSLVNAFRRVEFITSMAVMMAFWTRVAETLTSLMRVASFPNTVAFAILSVDAPIALLASLVYFVILRISNPSVLLNDSRACARRSRFVALNVFMNSVIRSLAFRTKFTLPKSELAF